jgi:hypothetical protein
MLLEPLYQSTTWETSAEVLAHFTKVMRGCTLLLKVAASVLVVFVCGMRNCYDTINAWSLNSESNVLNRAALPMSQGTCHRTLLFCPEDGSSIFLRNKILTPAMLEFWTVSLCRRERVIEYLLGYTTSGPLISLPTGNFVRAVGARTSAPGGGSVAALVAALVSYREPLAPHKSPGYVSARCGSELIAISKIYNLENTN